MEDKQFNFAFFFSGKRFEFHEVVFEMAASKLFWSEL